MADISNPSAGGSGQHFDTFETRFFQEGESGSGSPGAVERFHAHEELAKPRRWLPSRQFLLGAATGGTLVAVVALIAFWHLGGRVPPATIAEPAPLAPPAPAASPAELTKPSPAAVVAQAEPTPAAPTPAEPLPAPAAVMAAPAPVPSETPTQGAPPATEPAKAPAPADPVEAAPAPEAAPPVAKAPAEGAGEAVSRCHRAMTDRRNKEILAACAEAFAAEPGAADIAVALARAELDRGRTGLALTWAKQAVAVNPEIAESYVIIGEAEQAGGHKKAAKEAYQHYLRLAPNGRYAADLRAVVRSL